MKIIISVAYFVFFSFSGLAAAQDPVAEEIKRIELSSKIAKMVGADQAFRFGGTVARKKGIQWEEI
ncbi:MAG: hypothetical protein AB7O96_07990, partial [Pseudobdellovibrionaceae bacterium]